MDEEMLGKIKSILEFALENSYSDLYRKKYEKINLDGVCEANIEQIFDSLPFLTKNELLETPPFERLFANPQSISGASYTSGTSGKEPLIIFHTLPQSENNAPHAYQPYEIVKLGFTLMLVKPGTQWLRSVFMAKKVPIFLGNPYQMTETAAIAGKLKIDSIVTTPEILSHFLKFLKNFYDLRKIRLIILTSEPVTDVHRELFKKEFSEALFYQDYGSVETAQIGFQCNQLAAGEDSIFHIRSDKLFVEIISEEESGVGEIVITHLKSVPSLLIRYQTGDFGKLLKQTCKCGETSPLLKLFGRKYQDSLKVGGLEFHINNFEVITKEFPQYIMETFEAHFYQRLERVKIKYQILVKLTPLEHVVSSEFIKMSIESAFNERLRVSSQLSFSDIVETNIFDPIKVEFVKQEGIHFKASSPKQLVPHFN